MVFCCQYQPIEMLVQMKIKDFVFTNFETQFLNVPCLVSSILNAHFNQVQIRQIWHLFSLHWGGVTCVYTRHQTQTFLREFNIIQEGQYFVQGMVFTCCSYIVASYLRLCLAWHSSAPACSQHLSKMNFSGSHLNFLREIVSDYHI